MAKHAHHFTTLRNNGLVVVTMLLFLGSWVGQAVTGWIDYNHDRLDQGQPAIGFSRYLVSGHFFEATGENWESEFLQMGMFVILTAYFVQKGSPESNNANAGPARNVAVTDRSPWPVRRGGWPLTLYRRSLAIAFFLLFFVSFAMHIGGGHAIFNEQQIAHGRPSVTWLSYALSARFWFESLQNWQSEFLSLAAMVYLSVYLRYEGSAESKPVATPNDEHGD